MKELLSKDALVNVGLSSTDPKGNASTFPPLFFFFFVLLVLNRGIVLTNLFIL